MARASQTTQEIVRSGLVPSMTTPTADGDVIDSGRVFLFVENVGTASHDVTVQTPLTVEGLDVEQLVVTVAASEQRMIGPLPKHVFGRPSGSNEGRVYVDYATPADWLRAVVTI